MTEIPNELVEKVKELSIRAKEEYNANIAKVESYFKILLKDYKISMSTDLSPRHFSLYISLLKADNTEYFGANFTLNYDSKYDFKTKEYGVQRLSMNYGTCGSFDIKAEPEYTSKIQMMSIVVSHVDEIETLFASIEMPATKEYNAADAELKTLKTKRAGAIAEAKEQAIKDSIAVGSVFSGIDEDLDTIWKATITKITPKRVYLAAKFVYLEYSYKGDDKCEKQKVRYEESTGYLPTEKFITNIKFQQRTCICRWLNGVEYGVIKYIDTNDTPENILKNL